ncbi:MAG TPA: helix-turn-helix domain-containing protein, partial [Blastocatellia bacterium]|nr:helix-turn-helix domain-containing protein [Blastocatellia bacterium]
RELRNVIERAVLLARGDTIETGDLPFEQSAVPVAAAAAATGAAATMDPAASFAPAPMNIDQLENLIVRKALDREEGLEPEGLLAQIEGRLVRQALERTRGNKQAAANMLGIYRPRLYSMIKKHDLKEYM